MNTGKLAAYKQLTPPDSDLTGVINQQERLNNAQNFRKEQNAEKDRKNQLGLTKDLASINSGKKTQYLNFEHSLSDAFYRKGGLIEKYSNAQKRLQLNPSDTEAAGIMSNIKATVQQIATTKDAMLKYNTALTTGIAEGTISKELNKGFITNMQKINEGGVNFEIDDYGGIKIFNTGKIDLDGDGFPDEITLPSLTDKNNFGIFEGDFDINQYNGLLQKDFETYEKRVVNPDGDDPYETLTTAGLNPENSLIARDRYKSALGQNASSLTNAGKSLLPRYNLTEKQVKENPELYENFINKITSDFEKSRRKKDIRDVDQSAKNNARRTYLGSRKNKENPNSLRTAADNILNGVEKYYTSLTNTKLEEQGSKGEDKFVRGVEFKDGKLYINIKGGEKSNVDIIDTKDKENALPRILKYLRPGDEADKLIKEYRDGVSEETGKTFKNEDESIGKFELQSLLQALPTTVEKEEEIFDFLNKIGIKSEKTGFINQVIKIKGKEFKVNKESGMKDMKIFIMNNFDLIKQTSDPKDSASRFNKK